MEHYEVECPSCGEDLGVTVNDSSLSDETYPVGVELARIGLACLNTLATMLSMVASDLIGVLYEHAKPVTRTTRPVDAPEAPAVKGISLYGA